MSAVESPILSNLLTHNEDGHINAVVEARWKR